VWGFGQKTRGTWVVGTKLGNEGAQNLSDGKKSSGKKKHKYTSGDSHGEKSGRDKPILYPKELDAERKNVRTKEKEDCKVNPPP